MDVADLNALAADGLVDMLDPESRLFCYRYHQTGGGMVREGLSRRYTIMSLLGLYRFERSCPGSTRLDLDAIRDELFEQIVWVDNVGDLGLVLWLCAVTAPDR